LEEILTNDEIREMARAREYHRRIENGNRKMDRAEGKADGIFETAVKAMTKGLPVDVIQEIAGLDIHTLLQIQQELNL